MNHCFAAHNLQFYIILMLFNAIRIKLQYFAICIKNIHLRRQQFKGKIIIPLGILVLLLKFGTNLSEVSLHFSDVYSFYIRSLTFRSFKLFLIPQISSEIFAEVQISLRDVAKSEIPVNLKILTNNYIQT